MSSTTTTNIDSLKPFLRPHIRSMLISGVQQFTLLDFPGKTACIVFTPGCTFRCGYCHNPEFVLPENIIQLKDSFIPEASFFEFLGRRKNLLDGVVVSGGEPTNAADLLPFIKKIKELGFLVKLDTNGNRPDVLKKIFSAHVLDYIAMDVKTSLDNYPELVGPGVSPNKIKESIDLIKNSGIEYEFRTTLIKEVHSETLLKTMVGELEGAKKLFLQLFRPATTLNPLFATYHPFSSSEMTAIAALFAPYVTSVMVRA